jgi:hypothetical protein
MRAYRQASNGYNLMAQSHQTRRDSMSEGALAALRVAFAPKGAHRAGVHAGAGVQNGNSGHRPGRSEMLQATAAAMAATRRAPAKVLVVRKVFPTVMRPPLKASNLQPKDFVQASILKSVTAVNADSAPRLDLVALRFLVTHIPARDLSNISRNVRKGGYGTVRTALWGNRKVGIKLFKGEEAEKNACRELGQATAGHPCGFVCALLGYAWWAPAGAEGKVSPCLVFEWGGHTLHEFLGKVGKLDQATAKRLCHSLCVALFRLHDTSHLLHLDIKSNNVLYDKWLKHIWLIDLGLSQLIESNTNLYYGKIRAKPLKYWHAAEYLSSRCLTTAADVFALAFLLADVLAPLPDGSHREKVPAPGEIERAHGLRVEEAVLRCFSASPGARPTLSFLMRVFEASGELGSLAR